MHSDIKNILADIKSDADLPHAAASLARNLQQRAIALQTPQERRQQAELNRMMQTPQDKATLTQITDQAFRTSDAARSADQLTHILDIQGIPRFFSPMDQLMMRGFQSFGNYLPGVAVPLVKEKMREETANVILPAETELLAKHLNARYKEGVRMNVNFLGEALLGEGEAQARMKRYLQALQLPEIEVLSVKISTIYSQISLLAKDHSLRILGDRMELLYRAALKSEFMRPDRTRVAKFVYLDMEEYRDLNITAELFMAVLDRPGLESSGGGIALQAYLPDSAAIQKRITKWARKRVANGGAPVTIRIVKGANMEMERVESSIQGWAQPPFTDKIDTDANYKRMLQYGMKNNNLAAVKIGIASHNLFDVAYGLLLTARCNHPEHVQFEMLEGMANHQRRALKEISENILLYAPATPKTGFLNAIAYLIRRLDENTGPENFLRHAFRITVDSPEWRSLEQGFLTAFERIPTLPDEPRRTQNRQCIEYVTRLAPSDPFRHESDTDFALENNIQWAKQIIESWQPKHDENALSADALIAGEHISFRHTDVIGKTEDPSRPGKIICQFPLTTESDINRALIVAKSDPSGWGTTAPRVRAEILADVAQEIRLARADLIGIALAETGKLITESDPEISEAIDFVEYYARSVMPFHQLDGLRAKPIGPVAVIPPWNFPIAIPCGGVAAALAAGNTVILKPAMQSVGCAWLLCQCFWRAGVPKQVLQFTPGPGSTTGSWLSNHPDVATVILTGGTQTALSMLHANPRLRLLAETGGKNATIVTALSDRELAIKHVIQSAFGHSGQKCSATSLLILEDEVYHDGEFRETLADAIRSLAVGSAWDLTTKIPPLIREPRGALEDALKTLEDGEEWVVMPTMRDKNPKLWSPGLKWGVRPGSVTHTTEFFGPILGVMCARHVHDAITMVNTTGYGLTSGLESLDDREIATWRNAITAGNLYINRGTTGAIVRRQPFGGINKSAFGPGIKAGGPNYVAQFMQFETTSLATPPPVTPAPKGHYQCQALLNTMGEAMSLSKDSEQRIRTFMADAHAWLETEFNIEHDESKVLGQDNIRRYLPLGSVRVRVHDNDSAESILIRIIATHMTRNHCVISFPSGVHPKWHYILETLTAEWGASVEWLEESDEALAECIKSGQTDRIRYASPENAPDNVLSAVGESGIYICREPVLTHARIELLWYLREQSISADYHRYGNLNGRIDTDTRDLPK